MKEIKLRVEDDDPSKAYNTTPQLNSANVLGLSRGNVSDDNNDGEDNKSD